MKDSGFEALREAALKAARARHKGRQRLFLRGVEEDTAPSTGGKVYRCHVGSETVPNKAAEVVVLDHAGREVDIEELNRREGKRHFEPPGLDVGSGPTVPVVASASFTIDPAENHLTLHPGDSHAEIITVKVPQSGAASKVDVYFLADTTASMTSILAAVKTGAGHILGSLATLGADIRFGAGNYKDFPHDPYAFDHQQSMTNASAAVLAAINAWSASGGADGPEGQLYALHKLAETSGGAIGWRGGAKRILIWFGDYPAHDPICPAVSGEAAAITEASVTAKLAAEGITVLALSVLTPGLDGDPAAGASDYTPQCGPPGGSAGQASRIANATGGRFASGIHTGNIVHTIIHLATVAVGTINNLKLVPAGGTAPFMASITPAAGYGPLAGDREHELKFEVVFRGRPCKDDEQVFTGTIDAVADGNVVARKRVRVTVPPCRTARFTYSVKFVCGAQPERPCACATVRPGIYATEINIHNYQNTEVKIEKRMTPVVFMGAPAGREPGVAKPRAADTIVLPPHAATMDDCCRLAELLAGGKGASPLPLTVGFLEISSSRELAVTAVYTAGDPESRAVSIEVEQIKPAEGKRS